MRSLTDRSPEEIAAWREDPGHLYDFAEKTLTFFGNRGIRPARNHLLQPLARNRLPEHVWLTCDWSIAAEVFRRKGVRDLGAWVIDLSPLALQQSFPSATIEILDVSETFHELRIRFALHPAPEREASHLPIPLRIQHPPLIGHSLKNSVLGAFLYYGFHRDGTRGPYSRLLG